MFNLFRYRTFNGQPPGFMPPDEPIYTIPPIEREPELSLRADKLAESRDWGHVNLGLEALHQKGILGSGVLIAICDTGIDFDHQDLKDNLLSQGHRDFTGSPSGPRDRQGHGTHCSGISAACANGDGLIGAAPSASLLGVKVLGDQGSGASSWIAAGIRYAADTGADVISLSLGGPSPDQQSIDAIRYAISKGCWVVCAAGNDGGPATSYPGHYPESIAVAATTESNGRASFSTTNAQNDVAAPGVSIMSTLPGGRYGTMSGTSMATPYVAGCLALLRGELKRRGKAIPPQSAILQLFASTAIDLSPAGRDSGTGWGLISPTKMIAELIGVDPVPPPPPPPPPPPEEPVPTPTLPTITHKFGDIWNNTQVSGTVTFAEGQTTGTVSAVASRRAPNQNPSDDAVEAAGIQFFQMALEKQGLAGKVDPVKLMFLIIQLLGAWAVRDYAKIIQLILDFVKELK